MEKSKLGPSSYVRPVDILKEWLKQCIRGKLKQDNLSETISKKIHLETWLSEYSFEFLCWIN